LLPIHNDLPLFVFDSSLPPELAASLNKSKSIQDDEIFDEQSLLPRELSKITTKLAHLKIFYAFIFSLRLVHGLMSLALKLTSKLLINMLLGACRTRLKGKGRAR
jgi:hypothetical protein